MIAGIRSEMGPILSSSHFLVLQRCGFPGFISDLHQDRREESQALLFFHSAFDSAENLHAIKVSTLCRFPSVLHILDLSCRLGRADIFGNLSFLYNSTYSITA